MSKTRVRPIVREPVERPCGATLPDGSKCQNMTSNIGYCTSCNDRHWRKQEAQVAERNIFAADERRLLKKKSELLHGGIYVDNKPNGNTGLMKAAPALAPTVLTLQEVMPLAEVFAASGMFPTIKDKAQAAVKILAGRELGFEPIYSMTHIDVVQGYVRIRSEVAAALIKASNTVDYRTIELTPVKCTISFFRKSNPGGDKLDYTYTLEDAQKAGLVKPGGPWVSHPRVMLWNRAMSQGAKMFCPDVLGSARIAEDDDGPTISIGSNITAAGETKAEITLNKTVEAPPCDTVTGEVVVEPEPEPSAPTRLKPSQHDRLQALSGDNWQAFQAEVRKRHNCLVMELPEDLALKYIALLEKKQEPVSQ